MRRSLVVLALVSLGGNAVAQQAASGWYRDLEMRDYVMNPPLGSDNDFFIQPGVPPSLLWVLDSSGSMNVLPCDINMDEGNQDGIPHCGSGSPVSQFLSLSDPFFRNLGWNGYPGSFSSLSDSSSKAFDPDWCTGKVDRGWNANEGCLYPGVVYLPTGNGNPTWVPFNGAGNEATSTIDIYCNWVEYGNAAAISACKTHLVTYGYYTKTANTVAYPTSTTTDVKSGVSSCNSTYFNCQSCSSSNLPLTNVPYVLSTKAGAVCNGGASFCNVTRTSGTTCKYSWDVTYTTYATPPTYPPFVVSGSGPYTFGSASSQRKYAPAILGDALNAYPPKYVVLRKVVKDLVDENSQGLRMGLMTYAGLQQDILPDCAHFNPPSLFPTDYTTAASNLKTKVDAINFSGNTPLALTLWKGCQYFSGSTAMAKNTTAVPLAGVAASGIDPPALKSGATTADKQKDSICLQCEKSFIIQVTDGLPTADSGVPCRLKNWDGDCLECSSSSSYSTSTGQCTTGSSLKNSQNAGVCSSTTGMPAAAASCGGAPRPSPDLSSSYYDYNDDVAKFCYDSDLRPESLGGAYAPYVGKQNVSVSTVGFGLTAPLLEDSATKGGGLYASANNADELLSRLRALVKGIVKRATSFSVAPVSTVETKGSTYAFIPRFRPAFGARWEGHLYRFKLFNEFAAGCTLADTIPPMTADKLSRNPNADTSCNDVYLRDNSPSPPGPAGGYFVAEDSDGVFRTYDTTDPTAWVLTTTPAVPVWDAGAELQKRVDPGDPRLIYTAVDVDNDGVFEPSERIPFDLTKNTQLAPWLAVGTRNEDFCLQLAAKTGQPGTPPAYATDQACVDDVIKFVRGLDVLDEDADGNRLETRPNLLGDIFHSSPVLVTAPSQPFLCDLGLVNQCVSSVYAKNLTPGGAAAWDKYVKANETREQLVIAGANDGMLHAFAAGTMVAGDDPDTPTVVETTHYDLGSGREKWAFIPPDLLPKLKRLVLGDRHELFVDGTPMVRDVWADEGNPGVKDGPASGNPGEFHTMVVAGERQGGRHWFALDVTDVNDPKFRWAFPSVGAPNSSDELSMGESWDDFAPSAPPIVPVAVADTSGPITVGADKAREVWAVFLNGGHDSNMIKGRGLWVVDVFTGKLLWRFARQDATDASDPRTHLWPVPGTVSVLDLGAGSTTRPTDSDGLFDTAVFGDMMGQVWVARLFKPGAVDTSATAEMLVKDNWFAARGFVQFAGQDLSLRDPFFQVPAVAILPDSGNVRVYAGAGDRKNILDKKGGKCSPNNLTACIRKQCTVEVKANKDRIQAPSGDVYFTGSWKYTKQQSTFTTNTFAIDSAGPSSGAASPFESQYDINVDCSPPTPGGVAGNSALWNFGAKCDWGASVAGTNCPTVDAWPDGVADDVNAPVSYSRFYSFRLFNGSTRVPFTTLSGAKTYDAAALTDANLRNADATPFVPSSTYEDGWYVVHNASGTTDEDTASGSGIIGGCVLWNTLQPGTSPSVCGATGASVAYQYRANFITGDKSCGILPSATPRGTTRAALVPPPAPSPVVAVNSVEGKVNYSLISVEPGLPPQQTIVGQGGVLGPIEWLEVPRQMHDCRHAGGACR